MSWGRSTSPRARCDGSSDSEGCTARHRSDRVCGWIFRSSRNKGMSGSKGRALSRAPCDDDSSHDLLPFSQDVTTTLLVHCPSLFVLVFSVYGGRVCERTRCVGASCWPLVHRCSPSSLLRLNEGGSCIYHFATTSITVQGPIFFLDLDRNTPRNTVCIALALCSLGLGQPKTYRSAHQPHETITQLPIPRPVQLLPFVMTNPRSRPHRSGLP